MKITIAREKLQEGLLAAVASVVPGKATLPVLSNILLEATSNSIRLSATDLDITVAVDIPAEVEVGGSITLPAKKLLEITRDLPLATVRIAASGDQRATLECGAAKFKLLTITAADFPGMPPVSLVSTWHIPARDLQTLISHTSFAASTEESRPILNGVLWELRPAYTRMVATNGHRLAKMEIPTEGSIVPTADLIIPPKALEHVRRLFSADNILDIARSDNHIAFRSPTHTVFSRLIEGPYPDYDRVIPRDNACIAIVDRLALMSVLRRIAVVASDQTHRVKLAFNAALLRFTVQTPDIGEAQDELPIRYTGDPLDVGFNAAYLLEILKFLPTDEVRLTLKTADRAVTVEPEGWASSAQYFCLLMPLRLVD